MDPTGAGRVRGFRAPRADEAEPVVAAEPSGSTATQTDVLEAGPPGRKRRPIDQRWLLAAAAGVLVVALVIISVLSFRLGSGSAASADQASRTPTPTPKPTTTALPVTDLYRQVVPSVVLITTSKGSLGSGTIITATGTVLTANHVIAGGGKISILFADGTRPPRPSPRPAPRPTPPR